MEIVGTRPLSYATITIKLDLDFVELWLKKVGQLESLSSNIVITYPVEVYNAIFAGAHTLHFIV